MKRAADALVVGGGPAGAALAAALAGAGRAVVLIEREAEARHKVCGEFLSREAIRYLAALDIDLEALHAVPIETVRLAVGERVIEARLPFRAMSLSRRVLDEALLRRAAAAGAEIRRGRPVRRLAEHGGAWRADLQDGAAVCAGAAFLATGKHELRGWQRPPGLQPDLVGFKQHWRLAPEQAAALDRSVELTLFAGGYLGLEPVEDGLANLCLLVRRDRLARLGRRWEPLLAAVRAEAPLLDRRLQGGRSCWDRPLAIGAIPFGHVWRGGAGPWRLGDQAAVAPAFAGDGVSIALHSARLAAGIFLGGGTAADFHRRLAADLAGIVRPATRLARLLVRPAPQIAASAAAAALPRLMIWCINATRLSPDALVAGRCP